MRRLCRAIWRQNAPWRHKTWTFLCYTGAISFEQDEKTIMRSAGDAFGDAFGDALCCSVRQLLLGYWRVHLPGSPRWNVLALRRRWDLIVG
jgi:hypothetical protein